MTVCSRRGRRGAEKRQPLSDEEISEYLETCCGNVRFIQTNNTDAYKWRWWEQEADTVVGGLTRLRLGAKYLTHMAFDVAQGNFYGGEYV